HYSYLLEKWEALSGNFGGYFRRRAVFPNCVQHHPTSDFLGFLVSTRPKSCNLAPNDAGK
ncbi:MAG: hypothetical protein LW833_13860, partial [Hyphomicrobiales bacterium]|nr:hypothetical protein [Hyphomicrobiales bacterium]